MVVQHLTLRRNYGMTEDSRGVFTGICTNRGWANVNPIGRYYHGLLPALIQGPIARFGDTAANVGILALLSSNPSVFLMPVPSQFIAEMASH